MQSNIINQLLKVPPKKQTRVCQTLSHVPIFVQKAKSENEKAIID